MDGKLSGLITVFILIMYTTLLASHEASDANSSTADDMIEIAVGVTNIYQQNISGGISTHRKAGRFSGSYDVKSTIDTEKLAHFKGGSLYIHGEGVWSKTQGIDLPAVGSFFGVNGDARERRSLDITELWYQQQMLDDKLSVRFGKFDMTGGFEHHNCPVSFDCSSYANDETSQFLNNALINNPTIPFPDYGLGAAIYYAMSECLYVSAAAADAQADIKETGFNTAFHKEDYFLYIFETGWTPVFNSSNGPLQGAYRAGLWYDPQPKANSDAEKNYRDDVGAYLTLDQLLVKENTPPQDSQGLGAFARYGCAQSKTNDLVNFWSIGCQYQGLFDGRDDDVLAAGFAQGFFSNAASSTYTEDYEAVVEIYYNAAVTKYLNISPSVQYIINPGGDKTNRDALVLGLRAQLTF